MVLTRNHALVSDFRCVLMGGKDMNCDMVVYRVRHKSGGLVSKQVVPASGYCTTHVQVYSLAVLVSGCCASHALLCMLVLRMGGYCKSRDPPSTLSLPQAGCYVFRGLAFSMCLRHSNRPQYVPCDGLALPEQLYRHCMTSRNRLSHRCSFPRNLIDCTSLVLCYKGFERLSPLALVFRKHLRRVGSRMRRVHPSHFLVPHAWECVLSQ